MRVQPLDTAVAALVSAHILFSGVAALAVLRLHRRSSCSTSSATSTSLRRRLYLLLRLNSLWPVRLLLVVSASLLSLSELLRLPLRRPSLCSAYALASHSLAEPAFFSTLLFLLRASTNPSSTPPASFSAALVAAALAVSPFLILHCLFLFLFPHLVLSLPTDFLLLSSPPSSAPSDRCSEPLFSTLLLSALGAVYVPLFVSACWGAVAVVINKKLRIRLYLLAAAVVTALSVQVSALALSALWGPDCAVAQALALTAFMAVLVCMAAGEGLLVIRPVLDALEVVEPVEKIAEEGRCRRGQDGDLTRGLYSEER